MPPAPPAGLVAIPRKFTATYLRRFRFAARTIFDVGVGRARRRSTGCLLSAGWC